MGKTQQLCHFLPQLQGFHHDGAVVPTPGLRPPVGGAGGEGLVQFATQFAVVGVLDNRQVRGDIQSQAVTGLALAFGLLAEIL